MKRIVVLGAGESGAGAAVLAKVKGFDVFVSDMSGIKDYYKQMLDDYQVDWEEGQHTESLILNADEIIKSPGIPNNAPLILKLKEQGTPIISEIEFAGRYTDAKMICITGSNGKTTTTSLIYHIFKSAGYNVGLAGNIGRSLRDRLQMCVFPDGDMGKHAVTHYHTLENLAHVAVVRCQLETGRTHQIRVHMKHIGHPLFNDERYGGDQILRGNTSSKYAQFIHNCFALCPRQALHAKTLGFVHPATGQQMDFDSELPQDMECLIQKWRDYANALR